MNCDVGNDELLPCGESSRSMKRTYPADKLHSLMCRITRCHINISARKHSNSRG